MTDRGPADFLWRFASDVASRGDRGDVRAQHIPVNVYETDEDVLIVAPMPGVEAEDIDIEVLGTRVTLRASLRGPGQEDRRYLAHEWTYGPYERTIELPVDVDGEHANASHSNGVLALSLPKAARARSVRIPLRHLESSTGRAEGHSGHHTTREGLGASSEQ
jgi:HSP20 family protein